MQREIASIDVQKLRAGDQRAVLQWYKQFEKPLLRFILTKVSDTHDAQELCQNTFLSCLESLPLFKETSSLWTWMCSIARHEIADYFRKKYAKRVLQMIPFVDALLPEQMSSIEDVSLAVRAVLKKLSVKERELLLLKYVDGKSVKTIAKALGLSLKSVESSLYRARKAFEELYAE
jgi:RNA polymerase sigma-70 factor (ECF subfamily)